MTELVLATELQPEQRDCLTAALGSAKHLLALLNDILDFSKIEAEKLTLEAVECGLVSILGRAVGAFCVAAHEKGIELICDVDPNVPDRVVGDPVRLNQIISNLVGNAVKFTTKGEIVVSVRMIRPYRPKAGEQFEVEFSVQDTGVGIPP